MRLNPETRDNLQTAAAVAIVAALAIFTPASQLRFVLGLVAGMCACTAAMFYIFWRRERERAEDSAEDTLAASAGVDPWAMMRELMTISDQPRPSEPSLTKGSLMYSALILEEASELFRDGVVPALDRLISDSRFLTGDLNSERHTALKIVRGRLQIVAVMMHEDSKTIRNCLSKLPEFQFPLLRAEAVPMFDGHEDSVVVHCGFAIATGLPGAEGYAEVAGSNLSKRNPDSGVIDKTPDGKWIKGREYREPDLARVLAEAAG